MNKFNIRRKKITEKLSESDVLILYSGEVYQKTRDQFLNFSVNRNFYYLLGINQDDVYYLYDGKTKKESLFIFENTELFTKWNAPKLTKEAASSLSGIENVFYLEAFESVFSKLLLEKRKIFLDIDECIEKRRHFNVCELWDKAIKHGCETENIYKEIVNLRMIKDEEEVKKHESAIKATKEALEEVMKNLRPGLFEYQVEALFNHYLAFNYRFPNSFETIAASGVNASTLHYLTNASKIKENTLILLDLGCEDDFYISDISRCYPVSGKFSPRQRALYEGVLNVNKKCIAFLKPGVTWKEYNDFSYNLLFEEMAKIGLVKTKEELKKYYWHSIGHLIGLDTHDVTNRDVPLQKGMTLTVEPGIYIASEKIGIRIEDNVLITENGCVCLSKDIIKEVDEIEKFMKENNKYLKK